MPNTILIIAAFCVMQVIAQLFFKYGSTAPERWLAGFIVANLFGASSTWLLMMVYKQMANANIALGIAAGLSFLAAQVALAVIFHTNLTWVQVVGILAICIGMTCVSLGGRPATAQQTKGATHEVVSTR